MKKSRASEVEDLRRRLIICSARGCRGLFRADTAGLECVSRPMKQEYEESGKMFTNFC